MNEQEAIVELRRIEFALTREGAGRMDALRLAIAALEAWVAVRELLSFARDNDEWITMRMWDNDEVDVCIVGKCSQGDTPQAAAIAAAQKLRSE